MNPVSMQGDALHLKLYIQPKASRDQLIGIHGEEFKIAITAPPVDGKANAHLKKYLAKQFKVAKGQVNIMKGEQGRHKQIIIESPRVIPDELSSLLG